MSEIDVVYYKPYPNKKTTYYKATMMLAIDKNVAERNHADDKFRFKFSLFSTGFCDNKSVDNKVISYESYHDLSHYEAYGICHKHECNTKDKWNCFNVISIILNFLYESCFILGCTGADFDLNEAIYKHVVFTVYGD